MSPRLIPLGTPARRSYVRYVWNSLRQGKLWGSILRWLRARGAPVPMSWEAYRFDRYQRLRWQMLPAQDLRDVRTGGLPDLVSVVLPAYNGAALVPQALDSLLAQSYTNWELIAVDDGSTDQTGAILDEYARNEPRMRVIHQANQKLPRALNVGFSETRGEYLTWISCDNRMHPAFLEKMVRALQSRPDWDAVYANLDLIGEDGAPLRNSSQYLTYQTPYGSEHIRLPVHPTELNVLANNTVGAAFLYRQRAMRLAGEYNPWLHTVEDYDFWMRVNELLYLRHVPFREAVYDYRFHADSLTSRSIELKIPQAVQRLMLWDDFRLDFNLVPCLWWVQAQAETAWEMRDLQESTPLSQIVEVDASKLKLPEAGLPAVMVWLVPAGSPLQEPPAVPAGVMKVIVAVTNSTPEKGTSLGDVPAGWDAGVLLVSNNAQIEHRGRQWIEVPDMKRLCTVVDILARRHALQRLGKLVAGQTSRAESYGGGVFASPGGSLSRMPEVGGGTGLPSSIDGSDRG
jgi:glycosyltransferase involved in cell wall biosynthesis